MKAGAFTPATLKLGAVREGGVEVRSMKAGAFTPATLGDIVDPGGGLIRSMKAGAFTPATPVVVVRLHRVPLAAQ